MIRPMCEVASFGPLHVKIHRSVWSVGQPLKKVYLTQTKFPLYFTPLPRSLQWIDLHEMLHRRSSRGCNHLFQIFYQSAEGSRIWEGSNFAILHWLSLSPLTQVCATACLR